MKLELKTHNESVHYYIRHYRNVMRRHCPGFSWHRVNFPKKLVGLTQTSQSNGLFYTM